ncbi:MAG: HpcH/HpaI aldolase family protein [bacterium]|jgi:4-hydroxy-2-oxoheptanedioate aldolase
MRKNSIKHMMLAGKPVLGVFQGFYSPDVTEMFGFTGFDFVIIDTEHGYMSPEACQSMIRAAECVGITPIIRIPNNEREYVLRALDIGAMGVQVPMINSKADAERAGRYSKYPPKGIRGLAMSTRASTYGLDLAGPTHIETSDAEALVIVQIETQQGVDNLDEIVQAENVDVVFIGPTDLSQCIGFSCQPNHPTVQATIQKIIEKTVAAGKIAGIFANTVEESKKCIEMGARYIACGSTRLLGNPLRQYTEGFKKIAGR